MKLWGWLMAAAAIVAAPVGAVAQEKDDPEVFASVGQWTILPNDSGCLMSALFVSGDRFIASYDARLNVAMVSVSDLSAKSLKTGDKIAMDVVFAKPGVDRRWGRRDFLVGVYEGLPVLSARFDSEDILNDLARYAELGLLFNDRVVRALSLANSGAAITKLRECARVRAKTNPSDVFAD